MNTDELERVADAVRIAGEAAVEAIGAFVAEVKAATEMVIGLVDCYACNG